MTGSGYCDCKCRDCFEIAIADDTDESAFCNECEEAGCEEDEECCCEGAYGGEWEPDTAFDVNDGGAE
jgi:hypothetical protein